MCITGGLCANSGSLVLEFTVCLYCPGKLGFWSNVLKCTRTQTQRGNEREEKITKKDPRGAKQELLFSVVRSFYFQLYQKKNKKLLLLPSIELPLHSISLCSKAVNSFYALTVVSYQYECVRRDLWSAQVVETHQTLPRHVHAQFLLLLSNEVVRC